MFRITLFEMKRGPEFDGRLVMEVFEQSMKYHYIVIANCRESVWSEVIQNLKTHNHVTVCRDVYEATAVLAMNSCDECIRVVSHDDFVKMEDYAFLDMLCDHGIACFVVTPKTSPSANRSSHIHWITSSDDWPQDLEKILSDRRHPGANPFGKHPGDMRKFDGIVGPDEMEALLRNETDE